MSTATAVARQDAQKPTEVIEQYRSDFATVLPTHVNADQWVRLSVGLVRRNPKLQRVARENPGSFLAALLDCARLGLEPGDTYHLVPFGREVVGIVDYTGEIELMYRAGRVASVKAECVYANDAFRFKPGEMDRPDHEIDWFGDRGQLIGAYAYAVMKDGSTSRVVVMSNADMDGIKAVSKTAKQADSPWKVWPDRMYLKTVVHQLRKWVPTSAEFRDATTPGRVPVEVVSTELAAQLPPAPAVDYLEHDDEVADAEIVDDDQAAGDTSGHEGMSDAQSRALHALLKRVHDASGDARFPVLSQLLGREIGSTKEVSKDEASTLIDQLQATADAADQQAAS
jgi:recombination protein RecT